MLESKKEQLHQSQATRVESPRHGEMCEEVWEFFGILLAFGRLDTKKRSDGM